MFVYSILEIRPKFKFPAKIEMDFGQYWPSFCQNNPPMGGSFWQKEGLLQKTMTMTAPRPQRSLFANPNLDTKKYSKLSKKHRV